MSVFTIICSCKMYVLNYFWALQFVLFMFVSRIFICECTLNSCGTNKILLNDTEIITIFTLVVFFRILLSVISGKFTGESRSSWHFLKLTKICNCFTRVPFGWKYFLQSKVLFKQLKIFSNKTFPKMPLCFQICKKRTAKNKIGSYRRF